MTKSTNDPDSATDAAPPKQADAIATTAAAVASPAPPRGRRRKRRAFAWIFGPLALVAALAGGAFIYLNTQSLSAPDWLRLRIETRLAEALPGIRVAFGDVAVRVERNGLARVALSDVDITTAAGAPIAALSDLEAGLAPLPLLKGRAQLVEVHLTGAFVTLRRDRAGRVGLAFGDALPADGTVPDLPQIVAQIDTALAHPRLAALRRINADALTLRFEDARARRGWTVDGGRIAITRNDDVLDLRGDFAVLGGGAEVATLELTATSTIGETEVAFGFGLDNMPSDDIATQGPALAWMAALRAPISGALRAAMDGEGRLGPLSATLQIGAGVVQPNDGTAPIPFSAARTYFTYTPDSQTLDFDEIFIDSAWGTALAEGRAVMEGADTGFPDAMLGQFVLHDIEGNPARLFDAPIGLQRAEMDFRLTFEPFRFDLGRMRLDDPQLPLRLSGHVDGARDGWQLSLDAELSQATPRQVLDLWPSGVKPKSRNWIDQNIIGGTFRDAVGALRLTQGEKPRLYVDFAYDDAEVRYARTFPVAKDGSGHLVIHDNRLAVSLERGVIEAEEGGTLNAAGTTFVIPDMRVKPAMGEVGLKLDGPLGAVLSVLDSEPLRVLEKAKRGLDLAQGRATVEGELRLPLKKGTPPSEIDYAFEGTLGDVQSTTIVPGRRLAAQSLRVAVDKTALRIAGAATVDGVAVTGTWRLPMDKGPGAPSRLEARVELSQRFADTFGIALPPGTLSGRGTGDLTLDLQRGTRPAFRLTSTLAGLGIAVPAIGWRLGQQATGRLEVAGALGKPVRVDRLAVEGGGLVARGKVELTDAGALDALRFDRVRLGGWLDAPVVLRGRGKGQPLAIALSAGTVDLRNAPFGKGGQGTGSGTGPISLALNRLQISDGLALENFRGRFEPGRGLQGDFTAALNGSAAIAGTAVRGPRGSAFRIRSDDAGRVMRAAGLIKTARGGAMTLTLQPTGAQGTYDGALTIGNIRLRDAPAIGALLDAISIVGLLDQLEGPGIFFAEVDARFRLTPQQVILTRSSATGPSMGISLDGYYTLATKAMDLQGVLSPIYLLNGIGQIFTRKGEGLVGFSFNIGGTAETPRVSVNPLSILTPGMFREIFRRPPPEVGN